MQSFKGELHWTACKAPNEIGERPTSQIELHLKLDRIRSEVRACTLCSFVEVLDTVGYTFVACSLSGANASFVQAVDATKFPTFTAAVVPASAIRVAPPKRSGHPVSLKLIHTSRSEILPAHPAPGASDQPSTAT